MLLCLGVLGSLGALEAQAAAYYNLGAYWHAAVAASCSTIQFVQSVPSGDSNSGQQINAQSQTLTETSGNLLVAVVGYSSDSGRPSAQVTDTLGNTWYAAPMQGQTGWGAYENGMQIFYAQNIAGGANTVSAKVFPVDQNTWINLQVLEYSGVATADVVLATSGRGAPSASTTASPGSASYSSNCNAMTFATLANDLQPAHGSITLSAGAGWTSRVRDTNWVLLGEDNAASQASSGSVNASASLSASEATWAASQIVFRAQGSSTPPQPTQLAFTTSSQTLSTTWACSGALTIQAQNGSGSPVNVSTPLTVTLGGTATYFSDSSCTTVVTTTQILAGMNSSTVYFEGSTSGAAGLTASAAGLSSANQSETVSALAPFTWIGGGSCNGQWATAACWSQAQVPNSTQTAHFDSNCTAPCTATLGANTTVGGLVVHQGATGGVSVGTKNLTVASSDLAVHGGALNAGSGTLTVSNDTRFWGGTIDLSSSSNLLNGSFVIGGGTVRFNGTVQVAKHYLVYGGAIQTAGSILEFVDSSGLDPTWNIQPGSVVYNQVRFADVPANNYVGRRLSQSETLQVAGKLSLGGPAKANYLCGGGKILATGDVQVVGSAYSTATWLDPNPVDLVLGGSSPQLLDVSTATNPFLPSLTINSMSTVTFKGDPQINAHYVYMQGTLDFSTWNVTLVFDDPNSQDPSWNLIPGNVIYGNVSFADEVGNSFVGRLIPTGSTFQVGGTLKLGAATNRGRFLRGGGKIRALGDVQLVGYSYQTTNWLDPLPVELVMGGTVGQLLDASGATEPWLPSLTIDSTSTVTFKGTPTVSSNYTYLQGTLDFSTWSATLVFNDDTSQDPAWTITPGSVTYGNVSFADQVNGNFIARLIPSSSTFRVAGTLKLGGTNKTAFFGGGGKILALGNVQLVGKSYTTANWEDPDPVELVMGGTSAQLLDASGAAPALLPSLTIDSTSTVTFKGTPTVSSNYTYSQGTLDFTTWGSTLVFNDPYGADPTWTITPGTATYANVSFLDSVSNNFINRTIAGANPMAISGNLVLGGVGHAVNLAGGTLNVTGNVTVQNQGAAITTNINVGGNWTSSGTFSATGGTVTFAAGVDHTITGNNTFFGFAMNDTGAAASHTLTLQIGKTQTANGTLSLTGDASHRLLLRSSSAGTVATLKPGANTTLGGNLDVMDITKGGTKTLHTGANSIGPTGCAPLQNDTGWTCP